MLTKELISKGRFWSRAWSLIDGCTPVSEGCDNCWLASMAHRFKQDFSQVCFREDRLNIPLRTKKPTVFAIWSDVYHEAVTPFQIGQVCAVFEECRQHTFLIVTKRPERAVKFALPLPNVYHLVTVENQEMADKRIPHAMKIPGKVGLLIEPMLSAMRIATYLASCECGFFESEHGDPRFQCKQFTPKIKGVLLGGETGPNARPIELDWIRSARDQCNVAGVPFFLKHIDKNHGRLLDGCEHNDLPWR